MADIPDTDNRLVAIMAISWDIAQKTAGKSGDFGSAKWEKKVEMLVTAYNLAFDSLHNVFGGEED